ncbi:MAG: hypothetical protein L6Q49_20975, partial [Anaerolineales bacterium]|nr:hypothetical protein [Anaerolineales bacterium]
MFRQKFRNAGRTFVFIAISIALMFTSFGGTSKAEAGSTRNSPQAATINDAVVFVSRQIPGNGSVYYPQGGSMPGVQPYSRFQVAAPGKLIVRE